MQGTWGRDADIYHRGWREGRFRALQYHVLQPQYCPVQLPGGRSSYGCRCRRFRHTCRQIRPSARNCHWSIVSAYQRCRFLPIYRLGHPKNQMVLLYNFFGGGIIIPKMFYVVLKTKSLVHTSASFKAEISLRSPQKLFIFIILKTSFLDQSNHKTFYLILKTEALVHTSILNLRALIPPVKGFIHNQIEWFSDTFIFLYVCCYIIRIRNNFKWS